VAQILSCLWISKEHKQVYVLLLKQTEGTFVLYQLREKYTEDVKLKLKRFCQKSHFAENSYGTRKDAI